MFPLTNTIPTNEQRQACTPMEKKIVIEWLQIETFVVKRLALFAQSGKRLDHLITRCRPLLT